MPQLAFGNPLILAQVVWMALIFGALYLLLSRWALPQVAVVLEERALRIATDLDGARMAKEQADAAAAEVTARTQQATSEARAEIARAVATAKAEAAEQSRIATEALDAQLAQAEQRIAAARQSAMGAMHQVAIETTEVVVNRLTGRPASPAAIEQAVGQAMSARAA